MAKGIITFNQLGRYGRLGNQMFQIASTIGIARKNNFDYSFPLWKNYDHIERFGTKESIDVQDYFSNPLPIYDGPELKDNFIHWGYWPVKPYGSLSINGHLQSDKYFSHCQHEIRHYFRMKNEYEQNNYCAIHIRLGDYDDHYHPRLKMDYYKKAIEMFPAHTTFICFSDDTEAASKMFFDAGYEFYFRRDTDYIDDFKFMKSCKHFIIGNSTYSWWPAWLGEHLEKKIVAPANWFGPVAGLSSKDIYCKNWIVI